MGNIDWWPIRNKLLIKENQAKLYGDPKPYKLLVEGRIDYFFYSRIINDKTEIISVGKTIRPKPSNTRNAIVGFLNEIRSDPSEFENIVPLGVVDADYDNNEPDESNLVHTDTNDLETLLFSTGTFDIIQFPGMTESIKKSIECVSYQFGHIRKAIFKYVSQKKKNIRRYIDEDWVKNNCNLFIDLTNGLSIEKFLNSLLQSPTSESYGGGMGAELFKLFIYSELRNSKELDCNNNLIRNHAIFNKENIINYWDPIKGHDVITFSSCFLPDLVSNLNSTYHIDNVDSFIALQSNPQRIKNTKLFNVFRQWGIVST